LACALEGEIRDLDLVALGTIADMMPLKGENRALVALGIAQASRNPRMGLRQLAHVAGTKLAELTSENVAFQLAPRINAGGRLGSGLTGLKLLLCEDDNEALLHAKELDRANQERREIEDRTLEEALAMLDETTADGRHSVVLAKRGWHPGVIGIVASRLQHRYYRPTILIALDEEGLGRGSGRSIPGVDIAGALTSCSGHLVRHGGHTSAAGLTIREDCVNTFTEDFESAIASVITQDQMRRTLHIDAQVSLSEIDGQFVRLLERIQPVGHGNPAPILCTYGAEILPNSPKELRGGHLRFALRDGATVITAIAFRMGERLAEIRAAQRADVAFTPQLNSWQGTTTTQLVIKDIVPRD
jgi:single-stranded-DNA-specific exonuclease